MNMCAQLLLDVYTIKKAHIILFIKYFTLKKSSKCLTKIEQLGVLKNAICFSIQERIAMSSLQGLPPLPRSLSGFNLSSGRGESGEPPPPPTRSSSKSQRSGKTSSSRPSPPARQLTTLDTQLAVLRREMVLALFDVEECGQYSSKLFVTSQNLPSY